MSSFDHHDRQTLTEIASTLRDVRHLLHDVVLGLHEVLEALRPAPAALTFTRALYDDGSVERNPMSVSMSDTQKVTLTLGTNDAKGQPTPLPVFDTPPAWLSSDPKTVTVTPAADGLTAVATAVGPLGTATVTATASVGGNALAPAAIDVAVVTGGPAVALTVTAGTPEPQ
jgi:lysophospholipase L1-like esterase